MATQELRELRNKYKAAYTGYMQSVQVLSDASQKGEWPPDELIRLEQDGFTDLTLLRHALLEALHAHSKKSQS